MSGSTLQSALQMWSHLIPTVGFMIDRKQELQFIQLPQDPAGRQLYDSQGWLFRGCDHLNIED